jgi:hypothetical protein
MAVSKLVSDFFAELAMANLQLSIVARRKKPYFRRLRQFRIPKLAQNQRAGEPVPRALAAAEICRNK